MRHKQSSNWSFLLMRGPDQSVKQFNMTKRSLIATPVALMAVVTSCVVGLQLKAASELRRIEQQQASLQQQYNTMMSEYSLEIENKDSYITGLESKIITLKQEQLNVNAKLQELEQLEAQLQHFIQTYGSEVPLSLDRDISLEEPDMIEQPQSFQSSYHIATLAYEANAPIQAMTDNIEALGISMQQTLSQANHVREQIDAYPNQWPTTSKQLSSGFGYRSDPFTGKVRFHAGIDIAGKKGDAVFSAADGTVTETGFDDEYGRYIIIEHLNQLQTVYMHLDTIVATKGDTVVRGEKIGLMGNTGRSTGTHLHFQILQHDVVVPPLPFLTNQKRIEEEVNV